MHTSTLSNADAPGPVGSRRRLVSILASVSAAVSVGSLVWAVQTRCAMAATAPAAFAPVEAVIQGSVDAKTVPAAVVVVSQNGRVVFQSAAGSAGGGVPIKPQTIFWLASMSKPVTATAVMILVEEGKIKLDDPISKYLPEFKATSMVKGSGAPEPGPSIAATSAITVRELLTHTSGLPSPPGGPGIPPIKPTDHLSDRPAEIAPLLLEAQPGAKWIYNNGIAIDLAGRIVEVASGQPLDVFLHTRILDPLGMTETGYRTELGRRIPDETRFAPVNPRFAGDPAVSGSQYFSGAAGLWGTLADYDHFAQMLAQGGTYGGHRILKPASVAMMHSDQVAGLYHGNGKTPKEGYVFGFTMEVVRDAKAADVSVPNNSYGWEGAGGTHFWIMPDQHAVLLMYAPAPKVQAEVERTVTAALTSK